MLLCPRCTVALASAHGPLGSVLECEKCGGIAATMPVLRKGFEAGAINAAWGEARQALRRSDLPCPQCHDALVEVALRLEAGDVAAEACERCQIFWFGASPPAVLSERGAAPLSRSPSAPSGPAGSAPPTASSTRVLRSTAPPDEQFVEEVDPLERGVIAGLVGMPVTDGEPESDARPWATWALAAAMVAVTAVLLARGYGQRGIEGATRALEVAAAGWGFVPADPFRHGGATWVTSFFLHGGVWHLLGNAYFFVLAGETLEPAVGWRTFLGVLGGAILAACLSDLVVHPGSSTPGIGASGGVSGLLAFYALELPQVRVGFLVGGLGRVGWQKFFLVRAPVRWVFGLWFAWEIVAALSFESVSAHHAHVGGAAAGLAWWLARRARREADVPSPPPDVPSSA